MTQEDITLMQHAMTLARRGEGWVSPNPLVGAVIVCDGEVIAEGWHARYGDLHAERNAFRDADSRGIDCRGATIYVTLEPCCHHGHQPPCTEAIIEHGIRRVVMGLPDPNPLVAGKGVRLLQEAGIEVDCLSPDLPLYKELLYQNRIFQKFITTRMPWVTAKWAMTLDGKIASRTGDSKWVSSPESRQRVHLMRRRHKAIMCGIGTVLADDPMLNVRLPEDVVPADDIRQPIRIIADRHLRIPLDSQLARTAHDIPLVIAASTDTDKKKEEALVEAGAQVWHCGSAREIMERAGKENIDSILVEGGGILNESLFCEGLVDEVTAFIAPKIIGGSEALSPVEGKGFGLMADAVQLKDVSVEQIGNDIMVSGLRG
ncbi:MAG: bifunctional diaminohydroxyphosphoribosylaminopyrimidine deaminase/5-amino-6-(5-phosphoribosylamino)uracil reductase RibD [Prevotella sp.]|nr:bifunctional diaminohydroxyphosphoribosylaminopyrimidine deaminase/5-amino-6-(5-phosphoribosylamino)uracil reductase RibD [Prevotella sp.]